jgi:hypothetical protein
MDEPVLRGLDLIAVDEAQDLDPCTFDIVRRQTTFTIWHRSACTGSVETTCRSSCALRMRAVARASNMRPLTHARSRTMHFQPLKPSLRKATAAVLTAGVALLAACGGGGSQEPSLTPAVPQEPAPAPGRVAIADGFERPVSARLLVAGDDSVTVADNQVVVVLAEDITPPQYDSLLERLAALGIRRAGQRLDMRMLQLSVPGERSEKAVIDALAAQPGVLHAGYNIAVQTTRPNPPFDPARTVAALRTQKRALAIDPNGRWWVDQIDLAAARGVEDALGLTAGPTLAVVDTGMPADQRVMAESRVRRVNATGVAVTGDSTIDRKDHGLLVSAFALGDATDYGGVSRHARLLSVDVYRDECSGLLAFLGCPLGLGRTFITELAEGIRTAVLSDARVVNVSWGDGSKCDSSQAVRLQARREFRSVHAAAVNLARRNDKLLVFSAGNNCEKADDQLLVSAADPAADSWSSHALIVGASTQSQTDAPFSRMGRVVDLMAPGAQVSPGDAATDGTSFASPIVAGAAAVVQTIAPALSAPETRYLLVSGAESTIRPIDMVAASYRGYVGANGSTPTALLNVGNAARAARLTVDAPLKTLADVTLAKGASTTVDFEVEIPATGVKALDLVFVIDVSGSYGDDIAQLKRQATAIIDALLARGVDVQFGVSAFADFPVAGYGNAGDTGFQRLTRITGDRAAVEAGIGALTLSNGGDGPESQLEALYQVATGVGRDLNRDGVYDATAGDIAPQPMGFRPGAARVVLFATDAAFHDRDSDAAYPGAGFTQTVAALKERGIRVIALQSGGVDSAADDINRLVAGTGGSAYQLSFDSREIAAAIAAGLDAAFAEVDVAFEKIAGQAWITKVEQDKTRARAGEKVRFTLTLQGQRSASVDGLVYDLYGWVRANGSALLQRVKVPVTVVE